jgi:hypothetical protein
VMKVVKQRFSHRVLNHYAGRPLRADSGPMRLSRVRSGSAVFMTTTCGPSKSAWRNCATYTAIQ